MRYNKLGYTDIEVSEICLGTMTWGKQNTQNQAHQQLDFAVERGINFIDTAEIYPVPPCRESCHTTERYIGNWINKNRSKAEKLVWASKVAGPNDSGPRVVDYLRGGTRLNREQITQAIEGTLKRLQIDCLDLYQIHWPSRKVNNFGQFDYIEYDFNKEALSIFETLEVCAGLVKQGKIKYLGLSNESAWGMMQYLNLTEKHNFPRVVSIQNAYNLLQRAYDVGLSEVSYRENCGLLAYSPLAFGVLSGKYQNGAFPKNARLTLYEGFRRYLNKEGLEATQKYINLAKKINITPSQLAIAFTLSRGFVTSSIIGATTLEQLEENIACSQIRLSEQTLQEIEQIHLSNTNPCH